MSLPQPQPISEQTSKLTLRSGFSTAFLRRKLAVLAGTMLAVVGMASASAAPAEDGAIDVTAYHAGDAIFVVANAYVPVTLSEAWAVLNDYGHHAMFILDLKSSQVISQPGETLRVAQTKISRFGPFRFSVESTWEIETTPCNIVTARSVGGNIGEVKVVTHLHASGSGTRISYHVYSILKTLLPTRFLVGMVETDMEQRLQGLRNEMLRRKTLPSAARSTPVPPC